MGEIHAQFIIPMKSGLPGDVAIWTSNWQTSGDPTPDDCTQIATIWNNAMSDDTFTTPLSGVLSGYCNGSEAHMHFDTITDLSTGAMVPTQLFDINTPFTESTTGTNLPNEVALCLTYLNVSADLPARNKRGRMYIGPFNSGLEESDEERPQPSDGLVQIVANFGSQLLQGSIDSTDPHVTWDVWSRAAGEVHSVAGGWVDDEWDTQRRRGLLPTQRLLWATP